MGGQTATKASTNSSAKSTGQRSQVHVSQPVPSEPYADVLALQRSAGNRAVTQVLEVEGGNRPPTGSVREDVQTSVNKKLRPLPSANASAVDAQCACGNHTMAGGECSECSKKRRLGLQTKLMVNEPGDIYEQEADWIADQVMAMPADPAVSGAPPRIQRFAGPPNGQMDAAPASVQQALASPGRRLDPAARAFFEPRFAYDFSQVRVHTDSKAAESARALDALAYTVGQDVVFAAGQYAPTTIGGRKLLAHELTHAVQQSSTGIQSSAVTTIGHPSNAAEQEAENAANAMQEADVTLKTMLPPTRIQAQKTSNDSGDLGVRRAVSPSRQNLHPILQLPTTVGNRQVQRLLTRVAGAPVMLQRKDPDPAACLKQTDEILPSVGGVATIHRELTLTDTLGSEYGPLKKKILASTEARKFVCESGVPAVLALWDTRTVAGALDVPAARAALRTDTAKIYSENLDTSWLRRSRIVRAENELSAVASWVKSEEKKTQLPQLLLPSLPAPHRENVAGAAAKLDALIPVFESAPKTFAAAATTAYQLRERLDEARAEAVKAKNIDYIGGPREALEKAKTIATTLWQQLEAAHRGINVGDLLKTSAELAHVVAKLSQSYSTVDSDTIRGVRDQVNTLRKKVVDSSTQVTDLAGAARRVSFVLRYFAALNVPGFAKAPGKDEMKAMRGHLDLLGSDLELLFGSHTNRSFDFFSELANKINHQLKQRTTMETALRRETALVPTQADVLSFFRTLARRTNNEVEDAYTAYARAFFQHRIVHRVEDFNVTGLEAIFARPLSLAGVRPLVCSGYAVLGAHLLAAAGATRQGFIVAVRASAEQLRTNRLDDGHAVAVMTRSGATLYVSNDLVVSNLNDAIGPDAVAWEHKAFPLISARGNTVQQATEALARELAKR